MTDRPEGLSRRAFLSALAGTAAIAGPSRLLGAPRRASLALAPLATGGVEARVVLPLETDGH